MTRRTKISPSLSVPGEGRNSKPERWKDMREVDKKEEDREEKDKREEEMKEVEDKNLSISPASLSIPGVSQSIRGPAAVLTNTQFPQP